MNDQCNNKISFTIDKILYEREAILQAVALVDKSISVSIDAANSDKVKITLSCDDANLLSLAEAPLKHEITDQQVRRDLNVQFGNLRDKIIEQAFSPIAKAR